MNNHQPTITAVIIAKNEEAMIANCLETVRWCQEILVIDNGSTDTTVELAKSLGARVVSYVNSSFAETRTQALKYVKTDWLFYLDADERVTPRLQQEISVHMETKSSSALAINRENIMYGKTFEHGGWQDDWVTRVFLKEALTGWEGDVHESPVFKGQLTRLHTPLTHLTHRNTLDGLAKSINWTPIEARMMFEADAPPVQLSTLIRKSVMEVIRRAILKQGRLDGIEGWIEALIQGMNRLLVYVQLWELQQKPTLKEKYTQKELEIANLWKIEKNKSKS